LIDEIDAVLIGGKAAFSGVDRYFFEVVETEIKRFGCDGEFLRHLGVAHESVVGVQENPEAGSEEEVKGM